MAKKGGKMIKRHRQLGCLYFRRRIRPFNEDVRANLAQVRRDPEFKKRAECNRTNKVTGPKARTVHSQCSVLTRVWARRLVTKGSIYDIGNEAPAMLRKPTRSSEEGVSTSYTFHMVTQLQEQLRTMQNDLQSMKKELKATREELNMTRVQLQQGEDIINLNASFDSLSELIGHPVTRADNSGSLH